MWATTVSDQSVDRSTLLFDPRCSIQVRHRSPLPDRHDSPKLKVCHPPCALQMSAKKHRASGSPAAGSVGSFSMPGALDQLPGTPGSPSHPPLMFSSFYYPMPVSPSALHMAAYVQPGTPGAPLSPVYFAAAHPAAHLAHPHAHPAVHLGHPIQHPGVHAGMAAVATGSHLGAHHLLPVGGLPGTPSARNRSRNDGGREGPHGAAFSQYWVAQQASSDHVAGGLGGSQVDSESAGSQDGDTSSEVGPSADLANALNVASAMQGPPPQEVRWQC